MLISLSTQGASQVCIFENADPSFCSSSSCLESAKFIVFEFLAQGGNGSRTDAIRNTEFFKNDVVGGGIESSVAGVAFRVSVLCLYAREARLDDFAIRCESLRKDDPVIASKMLWRKARRSVLQWRW